MKKVLANYDEILTDDGSVTLYSHLYGEACHSTSGAREETQLHYIKGCQVLEKANHNPITIFEVGFGVGIGFLESYQVLKEKAFTFITTEIDETLVKYVIASHDVFKDMQRIETPVLHYRKKNKNCDLIILVGNARETTSLLKEIGNFTFDCIFQDAFSPKRNAILWTKEWFELLLTYAKDDCIMSTYSSSSSIRKSMLAAGWVVKKGEKFGPKRSSTRAYKTGTSDLDILEHLERSLAITITDENFETYKLESQK